MTTDPPIIADHDRATAIRELIIDGHALRELELEADNRALRELLHAALDALHAAHQREQRHREAFQRLLDELPARRSRATQDRQAAA